MILRTVTLHVRPGYEDRFYIQTAEVADWANTVPGIDYARVARVVEPDCRQTVVFVSEWQDAAALYAWNAKPETVGRGPLNDGGEVYWDDAMVALWEVMGEPLDVAVRGWAGLDLFPGFGAERRDCAYIRSRWMSTRTGTAAPPGRLQAGALQPRAAACHRSSPSVGQPTPACP